MRSYPNNEPSLFANRAPICYSESYSGDIVKVARILTKLGLVARRAVRRLHFELILARRGHGRPVAKESWERQYESGEWQRLNSLEELGHYMAIVGYIRSVAPTPSVIDLGCGHGRLLQLLAPHFGAYTGVDISERAVAAAERLDIANAQFVVSRFEDWVPVARADVIIFNESLSYAAEPVALLQRYRAALVPEGRFVVSLCDYGNHGVIWRKISEVMMPISSTEIRNDRGQVWHVRLYQPG